MEDEVRERLSALGEISAEVAHELRNALQIIAANVYLARQGTPEDAATTPFLRKIERQARLAQGIVDDLMALARGEAADAERHPLAGTLLAAREELPSPGATFVDELPSPELEVKAHAPLLARLFHALYENAIAASAPRPPVLTTRARAS